jgi:hypothetical protein
MEIQNQFANMSLSGPVVFTIGFILNDMTRTLLPPWIIWEEIKVAVKNRQSRTNGQLGAGKGHANDFNKLASPTNSPSHPATGMNWARYLSLRNRK